MKRILITSALAAVGICASARELEIRHAAELEIETERGHYYQLQSSTNLVDWHDLDDAIFGHGGRDHRLFSTHHNDGVTHEYYRVVITDAPTNGFAPWTFAGLTINLDNRPGGDLLQFLTETNGVDLGVQPDPFAYTFTRTGTNEVRIETHPPTYYFDRRNVYVFSFTGPGTGSWVRDEYRGGQLKDRDVGVFSYVTDGTNSIPPVIPTEIPHDLAGLVYTFRSGERPEQLEFTSSAAGIEFGDDIGDDEPNTFTYTYALTSSNTASFVATFKPDKWDEYYLTFTGNTNAGTFLRREFDDNRLKDTDTGTFTGVRSTP